MPLWKRNLIVCWIGMFATGIGVTFVVSAIFSPVWGSAADRFGRKPMLLRASLGMAVVIALMGFATSVYALIGLSTEKIYLAQATKNRIFA